MLIADALLSYQWCEGGAVYFYTAFVELDRATMAIETLVAKLGRYLRLEEYTGPPTRRDRLRPLWRDHYAYFPAVLVVLANGSRRRLLNRRRFVQALWERDHEEAATRIDLHVCLFEDLIEHGPFAAIFESNRETSGLVDWTGRPPETTEEDADAPAAVESDSEDRP